MVAQEEAFVKAGQEAQVLRLYCNGFDISLSAGDITLTAKIDAAPQAKINMSYTVAKTLARMMSEVIEKFESAVSQEIMTMDFVNERVKSLAETQINEPNQE